MSGSGLQHILFVDIETVSGFQEMSEMDSRLYHEWGRRAAYLQRYEEKDLNDLYREKAAIYAEFGKIIVIGMGYFVQGESGWTFRLKALRNHDEAELLKEFISVLNRFDQETLQLCAHNGKDFDFPYLSRRMLIHRLGLPEVLKLWGKKPWEVNHLDTMELWKFGEFRHYASLDLLAALFDIPSSKSELDGSMVGKAYYEDKDIDSIVRYCLKDVEVAARVYLRLIQQEMEFDILHVD